MTDVIAELAGKLTKAQREAVLFSRWDETPDSVSYECPFAELYGCYRHPHETGLQLRQRLLSQEPR